MRRLIGILLMVGGALFAGWGVYDFIQEWQEDDAVEMNNVYNEERSEALEYQGELQTPDEASESFAEPLPVEESGPQAKAEGSVGDRNLYAEGAGRGGTGANVNTGDALQDVDASPALPNPDKLPDNLDADEIEEPVTADPTISAEGSIDDDEAAEISSDANAEANSGYVDNAYNGDSYDAQGEAVSSPEDPSLLNFSTIAGFIMLVLGFGLVMTAPTNKTATSVNTIAEGPH